MDFMRRPIINRFYNLDFPYFRSKKYQTASLNLKIIINFDDGREDQGIQTVQRLKIPNISNENYAVVKL